MNCYDLYFFINIAREKFVSADKLNVMVGDGGK